MFRLRGCPGRNHIFVAHVKNTIKKHEAPNDLILRNYSTRRGGCGVMVSLGLRSNGVGALRFAPTGAKMNAHEYLEIVKDTNVPDCQKFYAAPPTCVFQKDGPTSRARQTSYRTVAGKSLWTCGQRRRSQRIVRTLGPLT